MVTLSCKNIRKSFGITQILKNISFNINEGEKVGLIGTNGAGKSTLFKIISSQMECDDGELYVEKNISIGYLSQHLELNSQSNIFEELLNVFDNLLTMEDTIKKLEEEMKKPYGEQTTQVHNKIIKEYTDLTEYYGLCGGYTYRAEINKVLNGLGFLKQDYTKKIEILSGGQKTRLALCKLLLKKPALLLLDEPTNHLDLDAIEWLEDYLKAYKGTITIISHDRYFLDAITNRTFEIVNGHINCYNGNYTKYILLKRKMYEDQQKAYQQQQSEIKRQEDIIERYKSFNREKSIKAAESRQKALDKIERIDLPDRDKRPANIKFETQIESGNDVLHIERLSKKYGDNLLFENLDMDIKKHEKIALIGDNGIGKTTLFKILMDKTKCDEGFAHLGKNVFIGYYDQEQSDLNFEKSVLDEVWDDFPELTTTQIRTKLAAFLFTGDDVFKKISSLSGGEKCRVNLIKLMLSKANFLLLDEPTNHLDIMSREALEDSILAYDGTVLVISHDRYFLNKVVDKILELKQQGITQYLGNYSYFIEKKKNPSRFEDEEVTYHKTKTQIQVERKHKKEILQQERDVKFNITKIEDDITNFENEIVTLQEQLCHESVYSNPVKSEKTTKQISDTQTKLDHLYEKWEKVCN